MQPLIHIQPGEAWRYYMANRKRLEDELVEIASNADTNTSIYMTDNDGMPYLYVYRDDKKIFQSECATMGCLYSNLKDIYAKYLNNICNASSDSTANSDDDASQDNDDDVDVPLCENINEMTESEFNTYVDEREDAILNAVRDMIDVLTEDVAGLLEVGIADDDCSIDKIVDNIVEYLAIECGLCIRRPMEVIDESTGRTVRTEYPYEEFDFGDGSLRTK